MPMLACSPTWPTRFFLAAAAALLAACSTIQQYEHPAQRLGQPLSAGLGDVVLRIDRSKDLPNVAGKADLWGRKSNTGLTEVRFLGRESDGTLLFARKDVSIVSNDSTVSRMSVMPIQSTSTTHHSGQLAGSPYTGRSVTTGTSLVATGQRVESTAVPSDSVAIRLKPGQARFRVGAIAVDIAAASDLEVQYQLTNHP